MNASFSNTGFYQELKSLLPASNVAQRRIWAATIIEKDIAIKDFSKLLSSEHKIATRFLWLLSEVGTLHPDKLFAELPFLFSLSGQLNPVYRISFATFWQIAGVPPENEGKAIGLLFQWLLSADTNVTIKSRALLVLFRLTAKYPELKNEVRICLSDQMNKHTNEFRKRVNRILLELGL